MFVLRMFAFALAATALAAPLASDQKREGKPSVL